MRSVFARLLVMVGVMVCAGTAHAQMTFAIRDVRVFDGIQMIPRTTVVVRDGVVTATGASVAIPEGAEVIEGAGRTLLPGLIDAHTHTLARPVLESALAFAVTTHLDMFTVPQLLEGFRREQSEGRADDRADLFSAGVLATAPRGHGTQYGVPIPTISTPVEAPEFVRARIAEGSEYIKIIVDDGGAYGVRFPTLDSATVAALIRAAHELGKRAVVHVARLADARAAVRSGADGLVHIWMDTVPDDRFVRELAEQRAFVVPTLSVSMSATGNSAGATFRTTHTSNPYSQRMK